MKVDKAFYFNSIRTFDNYLTDSLCVFIGDNIELDKVSFYQILETALKGSCSIPDLLVVFGTHQQVTEYDKFWSSEKDYKDFIDRTHRNGTIYLKEVFFIVFEGSKCNVHYKGKTSKQLFQLSSKDAGLLITDGLSWLIENNNVINIAPSGHTFKHLSGKKSKIFIQTRELMNTELELQFVARALSVQLKDADLESIRKVYIDSMGIYSLVKQALSYLGHSKQIVSFHSYEEISSLTSCEFDSLVIISASTSGGMAEIFHSKGWSNNRIVTVIDVRQRLNLCRTVATFDCKGLSTNCNDGWEQDIELVGEHFTYKAKPPKTVTIGVPHFPENLSSILDTFKVDGIKPLYSKTNTKSQLLSLDPDKLLTSEKFGNWLKEELLWSLSVSVNCVVYASDDASHELAERAKSIIESANKIKDSVSLVASNELNEKVLAKIKGVLVVTMFAGNGGVLRQISRDLREFETSCIPRHFLVGVGIPQGLSDWERLRQFLVRNASEREYKFSAWNVLAIGPDSIRDYSTDLIRLASRAQTSELSGLDNISDNVISDSIDLMVDVIEQSRNSLLPSNTGQKLAITDGFVFLGDQYDDYFKEIKQNPEAISIPQQDILLTVSAVLQAAREHKSQKHSLTPSSYESVVISPENFLRFNDDILQACLIRASRPSELDYSSDKNLSEVMSEFLNKVFERNSHPFGYAALEFAAALALGKIKLKKEDLNNLLSKAFQKLSGESALLGFLYMTWKSEQ